MSKFYQCFSEAISQVEEKYAYFLHMTNLMWWESFVFYKIAIFILEKKIEKWFSNDREWITLKDIFKNANINLIDKEETRLIFLSLLKSKNEKEFLLNIWIILTTYDELITLEIKATLISLIQDYAPDIDYDFLLENYSQYLAMPVWDAHVEILQEQMAKNFIPDISEAVFLELYPEFESLVDKDWLTNLSNITEYNLEWVYYKDYFIHFDWAFKKLNLINPFLWDYLYFFDVCRKIWKQVLFRIKLDFNNIVSLKKYKNVTLIWWAYFWPDFKKDSFFESSRKTLFTRKIRDNLKFSEFFNNEIFFTDFFIDQLNHSFQIEEITSNDFWGSLLNRFIHAEFDIKKRLVSHFDGSILLYDIKSIEERKLTLLSKYPRLANPKIKLFRMDGEISSEDLIRLTLSYFERNELVLEYFDNESYKEYYSHLLS